MRHTHAKRDKRFEMYAYLIRAEIKDIYASSYLNKMCTRIFFILLKYEKILYEYEWLYSSSSLWVFSRIFPYHTYTSNIYIYSLSTIMKCLRRMRVYFYV